ncbi:ABC transporter permease [Thermoproteus tenax]|uniref:ABC-type multidrug transport system, permease component n=1 Tax=Thermoproteus tenax (strain ATCC 35583 / DSM 2078 / JCM 9277 / NBRC 100435 / Kra 1) TaxID=768679 RepID=G4RJG0_THETK|nr:ABC transporter permease [Thermoproteus tenax]CCC81705.1 ABC-type multidrug transport system, permease component [Thermoproteus tenax Kra 1]
MSGLGAFWGLYKREIIKIYRRPPALAMTFVQPIIWIIFFGSSLNGMPKEYLVQFFGTSNYIGFILPGQLATSMLFIGTFSSMSIVWDRRFGFLKKILVTPAPREAVFFSKVLGAVTRGLLQVPIMLAAAAAFGVRLPADFGGYLLWMAALVLLGLGFSSIYLSVAMRSSDWQLPQLVANVLNLPLMFTSTALFPKTFYPAWMRAIADVNPITFATEIGRGVVLSDPYDAAALAYLAVFAAASTAVGLLVAKRFLTVE